MDEGAIAERIQQTLPMLTAEKLEVIVEKLKTVGVSGLDDLQYIQERDLVDILNIIQIRKLARSFEPGNSRLFSGYL